MGEFEDVLPTPTDGKVDGHQRKIEIDVELLADLGHQLRTQLKAVVGAAGLLAAGAETSEERELAAIVETGAEQVARIVDDVLDGVTLDSGDFELALHPFDVRATVESCLALVSETAGAKGLDVSFSAAPDVPNVAIGDSRRLEQILLTLLHGAVDRTYRGGIGVELTSEDRGGGLAALHLRIRDTGRGVPATLLRGRIDGGTGPHAIDGLEISAGLRSVRRPDQMPIVLILSSTPAAAEAAAADSGVIQAMLTKPVPPRTLHDVLIQVGGRGARQEEAQVVEPGALRVLVADDNALNQNLLKRLVVKLGHTVDVVANGREAVQAVAQQPYDAVLMDVLMPEMDGLAAAEAICRRWPRGNRPRLIALTAMAGPGDQERCLRAGFDDYMSKPVRMEDLTESLKSAAGYRTNRETVGL